MKKFIRHMVPVLAVLMPGLLSAADPAVTIYNQDFGVVREIIPLQLKQGVNEISFNDITAHLEPDSVILRDPKQKVSLQILEQNYRADPVSQELLLSLYEGQTIGFQVTRGDVTTIVQGRIVRSGYVPHQYGLRSYGQNYAQTQYARSASGQPVIEMDGRLRFNLPGIPLFPALKDEAILKPTLLWTLESGHGGRLDAELAYITDGMGWEASYNIIAPEHGDVLDVTGWITMDNQSGKTFENAYIKLMAGDVSRVTQAQGRPRVMEYIAMAKPAAPPVTEKAFDEFHLYTLERKTTLRDRETKQVEFIHAHNVASKRLYIYDGAKIDWNNYSTRSAQVALRDRNYGTDSNPKVWVMQEYKNSSDNHLGIPLPRGRVRFYRRDTDGRLEFTGENMIDHTPRDETLRIYTGDAFDINGERTQTDYTVNGTGRLLSEAFAIKLRNHKDEDVEVRVIEHLYRWVNWKMMENSDPFTKSDSRTAEFRVPVQANGEKTVTYTVQYTW